MTRKPISGPTLFFIDGGSRGNPGPAGYGVVVKNARLDTLDSRFEFLGVRTNNYAEYSALLAALEYALSHHLSEVRIFSDSELLVRQMNGMYRVKSADLRPLFECARAMAAQLPHLEIKHIRREQNRDADRLANKAMDQGERTAAPRSKLQFRAIVENGRLRPLAEVDLPEKKIFECILHAQD